MAYSEQKAGKNSESQGRAEARPSRGDLLGEGRASARPQWKWRVERRLAWQGGQPRPAQKEQTGRLACGRRPTLKTMKTAPRTWKAEGKRMCRRGAGVPPARRLESGKQAKMPMFSVISRQPWTPLPGVRHLAAPWRMGGGRMAHAKFAKCAGGGLEGRTHAEARRRGGMGGRFCTKGQKGNERGRWSAGGESTLKTMKTASRTWTAGGKRLRSRGTGVPPAERQESGKQAE